MEKSVKAILLALKVLTVDVDTLHPNQFYPPKMFKTILSYGRNGVVYFG